MSHYWARLRRRLGLHPDLHLHDLRGSYITMLAERGVNLKAEAKLAGHADIKVTAEIYQRVTRTMIKKAAEAVAGLANPNPPEAAPEAAS